MSEILIEGIKYTNIENALSGGITTIGASKIGNAANKANRLEEGDIPAKVVNAIEIDWNGAKLDNVELSVLDNKNTVNTTGQLLALINDLQEQINAIVYIMNGGNTGGDNSGSGSNDFSSTTTSSTTTSSTGTPTPTQTGR